MELLAMSSHVLYERDILNKQQHILRLEKELSCYKIPTLLYESELVWSEALNRFFNKMRYETISITDDDVGAGLINTSFSIQLEKELVRISHHEGWANQMTLETVEWTESIALALQRAFVFEYIDSNHPNLIWLMIRERLEPILACIPMYKCSTCEGFAKVYISDDGECYTCENISLNENTI